MYSPFLSYLVVIALPPLLVFSSEIVAPSTGAPWASVILPLICPVCANAGAATDPRPRARIAIATVRRIVATVMESSSCKNLILQRFPGGRRFDVGDEVFEDRAAARRLGIDRP